MSGVVRFTTGEGGDAGGKDIELSVDILDEGGTLTLGQLVKRAETSGELWQRDTNAKSKDGTRIARTLRLVNHVIRGKRGIKDRLLKFCHTGGTLTCWGFKEKPAAGREPEPLLGARPFHVTEKGTSPQRYMGNGLGRQRPIRGMISGGNKQGTQRETSQSTEQEGGRGSNVTGIRGLRLNRLKGETRKGRSKNQATLSPQGLP